MTGEVTTTTLSRMRIEC